MPPSTPLYIRYVTSISLFQPGEINTSLPFPTEWNNLLLDELHLVAKCFLSDYDQQNEGKMALFADLLRFRVKHHAVKLPENFTEKLNPEDAAINGLALLDFIYQENNLTRQPYPKLTLRTKDFRYTNLVGPADDFDNITCGEFEDAEIFFYKFMELPDPEPLAHLASILWRKKGVPYLTFNEKLNKCDHYDAEKMVPYFLRLHPWILYTFFTWYCGCRNQLPKFFPTVFKGEGKKDDEPDFIAFTKCIHSGAGTKNGSRDHIRMTLLKEYFFEMELEAQKAEDFKRKHQTT